MSIKVLEVASRSTYANADRSALSRLLGGERVRLSKVGTPVSTTDGKNGELCDDDGGTNSSSDFLGGLDAESNVSLRVSDNHDSLETSALTGTGLFLDGLDL
jgi:hypothetical protein